MQDNTERQLSCNNGGNDNNRARHCEMREQNYATVGRLNVDEVHNDAVSVKGALRGDVLVRSRVESYAETQSTAAMIGSQVPIDGSGGQVRGQWAAAYGEYVVECELRNLRAADHRPDAESERQGRLDLPACAARCDSRSTTARCG